MAMLRQLFRSFDFALLGEVVVVGSYLGGEAYPAPKWFCSSWPLPLFYLSRCPYAV